MKHDFIGITRALAISGATDFSFVDEESKWKGSEIHRMIQLYDERKLQESTIPTKLRGYLAAHKKFMAETGFIPQEIEFKVQDKVLGVRGRLDRAGLMKGKRTIVDFKSGSINPAVALQLCLGGHLLEMGQWFNRCAVRLKADGNYGIKYFPLMMWHSDLATAISCVRVARWKIQNGVAQ